MGPGPGNKTYASSPISYTAVTDPSEAFGGCSSGGTTSGSDTSPIGSTGLLLTAVVSWAGAAAPGAITDSKGNSFTQIGATTDDGITRLQFYRADSPVTVGSGHTFTVGGGSSQCISFAALGFSRTGSGYPSIVSSGITTGTHPFASASVTSTVNDAAVITVTTLGTADGGISSVATGYTVPTPISYSSGNYFGVGYAFKNSMGAPASTTATWNPVNASVPGVVGIVVAQ